MSPISSGIDERQAIDVTSEDANRFRLAIFRQSPSIPHFAETVVSSGEEDLRCFVSVRYGVDIVVVGVDL